MHFALQTANRLVTHDKKRQLVDHAFYDANRFCCLIPELITDYDRKRIRMCRKHSAQTLARQKLQLICHPGFLGKDHVRQKISDLLLILLPLAFLLILFIGKDHALRSAVNTHQFLVQDGVDIKLLTCLIQLLHLRCKVLRQVTGQCIQCPGL